MQFSQFVLFNCTLKKAAACSRNISNDSMSRFGVGSERILTMIPNSHPRLSLQEYKILILYTRIL